jgi:phosphate transport system substrate-binding protein
MFQVKKTLLLLSALVLALGVSGCSKSTKNRISIKGSTTVLPITQKAMEEYSRINKDVAISIDGSGSGNGIKALIDGTADIANSSREMKDKEIELAKSKGIDIEEIPIALDCLAPVIHPKNKLENITLDQLKGIFTGTLKTWDKIPGADSKENIVVVSRDTSSGTFESWHEIVLKKADVKKDALMTASSGQVATTVAGNEKAIGYVGFGYLNESLRALKVNGVEPTIENGKSGKFPISRKLYVYVNKNKISKEARAFIDYILSPEGQKVVKKAGFIPVK